MPLSPEWQLLLSGAKTQPTSADIQRIQQALGHDRLDWARLTQRACAHGIAPLLYHTVQHMGVTEACPAMALEAWQRVSYATAVTHTLFSQALQRVLRALQELHIAVIVLKGAALAETVYPGGAVRPRRDTDVLVRGEDLARVADTLGTMGYHFTGGTHPQAWWRAEHYHWTFRQPNPPPFDVPLEVHWHLDRPSRPFAIDLEGLWQRATPATIAGVDTHILAPEDGLLYLSLHACHHAGAPMRRGRFNLRLLSCCDVAEVIRHYAPSFDWDAFVRRAQSWGVIPYVYLHLLLARDLVGAAVPESVLAALTPQGFDGRLLGWARDELLEDLGTSPLFPDLLRLWWGPGVRERAAIVGKLWSPAAVARSSRIPPAFKRRYGHYLARLTDLVRRYGPVLWRLIRHDPALMAQMERKAHLAAWLSPFMIPSAAPIEAFGPMVGSWVGKHLDFYSRSRRTSGPL
jgi:putative nucleotidyltransferase-like protein